MKKMRWLKKKMRSFWARNILVRLIAYTITTIMFFLVIALFYLIAAADYAQMHGF